MPDIEADPLDGPIDQPTLQTERLTLRALKASDWHEVDRLASDHEVSRWTSAIPHPLPSGASQGWIAESEAERQRGEAITYAIVRRSDRRFLGGITLRVERSARQGDVGYWLGLDHWSQGYGTEALKRVIAFGFDTLVLDDIIALTLAENAGSLRIQEKAGMIDEGVTGLWHGAIEHEDAPVRLSRIRREAFHG